MFTFIERQPKPLLILESLLLVGIIGGLELKTGYEVSLVLFYSVPILFAVRFCDRGIPFAIASLACVTWCWTDFVAGHQYFNAVTQGWEISIRCAFFFIVAIAGVAIRDRNHATATRLRLLEHSRRLEQQINEITEYEKQRTGRELHDGLSQYLAAVSCATTSLKMDLERQGLAKLAETAGTIEGLLSDSVNQARDLARSLAPVQGDEAALAAALQELAAATRRRFAIACTFETEGDHPATRNGKATHLYRIAQEAIDNAVSHGKAQTVDLRLSANPSTVSLSITDDGIGFPKTGENLQGTGISVMRYRASMLGGELSIEERANGGTIVSCTFAEAEVKG